MSGITWRTHLVDNEEALRLIDEAVADRATKWGRLSASKLEQAIDVWVDRYDPGALRRTRIAARSRDVSIGASDDVTGTASLWGRLYATDAELLKRRLAQMISEVCDDDPRTIAQRRADALGALAAGAQRLACQCGNPDCPAGGAEDARATSLVVHVIADQAALEAQPDPYVSGEYKTNPIPSDPPDAPPARPASAVIVGGGAVPTPLLAELIQAGATIRTIRQPDDEVEPCYRPSAALAEFVRMRDLTCRFPGCDRPAEFCDVYHTHPYPAGVTHPSNNKCLCRLHHLLKTFWCGKEGWSDQQLADGTVIWTAPTGRTYTTRPGSRIFFPAWNIATADLPPPSTKPVAGDRGVMMPRRRRTRSADLANRIKAERALNDAYVAERNKPPPI